MANIMDMVRPLLEGGALDAVSRHFGESRDGTRRTLETAFPASIAGMADYAADEDRANGLMDEFRRGEHREIDAAGLTRTLGDPTATGEMLRGGEGLMNRIFGNKAGPLLAGISGASGMPREGTSRLMSLVMPILMGLIGKHAMGSGLDG